MEDEVSDWMRPKDGRCECCGFPNRRGTPLAYDRDPGTQEQRGWICLTCKAIVDAVNGDTERLARVQRYLGGAIE